MRLFSSFVFKVFHDTSKNVDKKFTRSLYCIFCDFLRILLGFWRRWGRMPNRYNYCLYKKGLFGSVRLFTLVLIRFGYVQFSQVSEFEHNDSVSACKPKGRRFESPLAPYFHLVIVRFLVVTRTSGTPTVAAGPRRDLALVHEEYSKYYSLYIHVANRALSKKPKYKPTFF